MCYSHLYCMQKQNVRKRRGSRYLGKNILPPEFSLDVTELVLSFHLLGMHDYTTVLGLHCNLIWAVTRDVKGDAKSLVIIAHLYQEE